MGGREEGVDDTCGDAICEGVEIEAARRESGGRLPLGVKLL